MKRCPKCNRTYSTDTQKFCTHDGGLLFTVQDDLGQTVQFDSSKVRPAVAKPTTRDLNEQQQAAFDPEATVVSSRVSDGTQQVRARDTGSLQPPPQTQYYGAPASEPNTGPVAPPPPVAAPAPPPAPPVAAPAPPPPAPPAAAPAPPTQSAAPLPAAQAPTSGPIAPTATPSGQVPPPPVQAAAAVAQPSQRVTATATKKKSKQIQKLSRPIEKYNVV